MRASEAFLARDRVLEESLATLVGSPLQKTIIFQGGGALHFIYSSPRYSSDIDFVDPTISLDIESYLDRLLDVGSQFRINYGKIMSSGRGVRVKWGHQNNHPLAKIEIEERDKGYYSKSPGKYNLFVKEPQDIYTDKIFSNIARYYFRKGSRSFPFKPNDFFDIRYINETLNTEPSPPGRVKERANNYNLVHILNAENIDNIVHLINDENNHEFFRHCIKKTMLPDVYRLINFDKKYFRTVADHFDQYRKVC